TLMPRETRMAAPVSFIRWLALAPQILVHLIEMPRQFPQRITWAGGLRFWRKHLYQAEFQLDVILAECFVKEQVANLSHVGITLRIAWDEQVKAEFVVPPQ